MSGIPFQTANYVHYANRTLRSMLSALCLASPVPGPASVLHDLHGLDIPDFEGAGLPPVHREPSPPRFPAGIVWIFGQTSRTPRILGPIAVSMHD